MSYEPKVVGSSSSTMYYVRVSALGVDGFN